MSVTSHRCTCYVPRMTVQVVQVRVCDMCPDDVEAVISHKITLDGNQYQIDACQKHSEAIAKRIGDLVLHGAKIKDASMFDRPKPIGSLSSIGRKAMPEVAVPDTRSELPVADYADSWTFTDHARARLAERGISEWDALRAAQFPHRSHRDQTGKDDLLVQIRDNIKTVVNPHERVIVTVAWTDVHQKVGS